MPLSPLLQELPATFRAIQDDLRHVLWIGGPSGAGKTSVARGLARRHGLRWYNADAHTWEHRDRALAAGHPGAIRWEAMSVEERKRIAPEEVGDLWIHWERGPMVVDDVRALPRAPLIVAEGTTVPPVDPSRALWLVRPSAEPNFPVYRHLADAIVEHARQRGVRILTVEGSLEETIAAVERHFADALAAGPRAESADERRALLRYANEALTAQVRTFLARPWATGDPE